MKPKISVEEVMAQVAKLTPHLVEHMYLDRDWIWFCGPSLQGEPNKATRESLKEIGFRFSMGGHLMPDGKTIGRWGHSALRPMFNKHKHAHRKGTRPTAPEESEVPDFASLGL